MASISPVLTQVGSSCITNCLGNFLESKQVSTCHSVKTPSLKFSSTPSQRCYECVTSATSPTWKQFGVTEDRVYDRHGFQFCSGRAHISPPATDSTTDSPFTEKYSPKKTHGRGLVSNFSRPAERDFVDYNLLGNHAGILQAQPAHEVDSLQCRDASTRGGQEEDNLIDESEMSSQLPELREVLTMLRQRWEEEAASGKSRKGPGNVFLVGTGPGDPELLTVKALRLMQSADLVLYDRLVSTDILDLVHAGARLLYVGKTSGFHSRTQAEIHELLLNFAEAGATVVRLKGGDPLVFGRGGEEMDFLQDQGIQVKVVPGITAASGIAAELGIPLTHRGAANSVRFLTGHSRKGGDDPLYVAEQAADPDSTLVIYMGLATLRGLAAKLMAHGLSPDTPAAAVERGTTPQQRTVFGTLSSLSDLVSRTGLVSPTLIFIGRVVALSPLWPSDAFSEGAIEKEYIHHSSTFSSATPVVGNTSKLGGEPRDRLQRGPDPVLPSQQ